MPIIHHGTWNLAGSLTRFVTPFILLLSADLGFVMTCSYKLHIIYMRSVCLFTGKSWAVKLNWIVHHTARFPGFTASLSPDHSVLSSCKQNITWVPIRWDTHS